MRIRGVVERTCHRTGGGWHLPLVLKPWRDPFGQLRSGAIATWYLPPSERAEEQLAPPAEGSVVDLELEPSVPVEALGAEVAFVAWAPIDDAELVALAQGEKERIEPLRRVRDAVLGTFDWDGHDYWAHRALGAPTRVYALRVRPRGAEAMELANLSLDEVAQDLASVRDEVAWLEANVRAIAEQSIPLLRRLLEPSRAGHHPHRAGVPEPTCLEIAQASFDAADLGYVWVTLDDGEPSRRIYARIEDRRVVDVVLSGWG